MTTDFSRPELYINRELSWLEFNRRVLEEALDDGNPLLERVNFLGIVADILDEFFEVRVAGLLHIRDSGRSTGPDGMTPDEQLKAISRKAHELMEAHYRCWNDELLPALAREGIFLWEAVDLGAEHLSFISAGTRCSPRGSSLPTGSGYPTSSFSPGEAGKAHFAA